jgi:hypothetical protein
MKCIYVLSILTGAFVMSGCTNEGGRLAKSSGDFAQCSLAQGDQCTLHAPEGTSVEKASVAAINDAVVVNAKLDDAAQCEGYARNALGHWPGYVSQAVVNHAVVAAYGEPKPSEWGIKVTCKEMRPPYQVSLTVTKAP